MSTPEPPYEPPEPPDEPDTDEPDTDEQEPPIEAIGRPGPHLIEEGEAGKAVGHDIGRPGPHNTE